VERSSALPIFPISADILAPPFSASPVCPSSIPSPIPSATRDFVPDPSGSFSPPLAPPPPPATPFAALARAAALIFFLWRHFTLLHTADQTAEKDAIDKEKRGLLDRLSKAKKAGADKLEIQQLQMDMAKL